MNKREFKLEEPRKFVGCLVLLVLIVAGVVTFFVCRSSIVP